MVREHDFEQFARDDDVYLSYKQMEIVLEDCADQTPMHLYRMSWGPVNVDDGDAITTW